MPKFAATDYTISINGTSFATSLNSVELALTADDLETTAFGGEWRTRISGLKSGSITLNFMQDFGAGSVDATLYPLFGSNATVVMKPTSSATGTVNPAYTAVCLVTQYSPFASSVGDIATLSVTWPTSGTVTRATA
jgi:predicted secreted protein